MYPTPLVESLQNTFLKFDHSVNHLPLFFILHFNIIEVFSLRPPVMSLDVRSPPPPFSAANCFLHYFSPLNILCSLLSWFLRQCCQIWLFVANLANFHIKLRALPGRPNPNGRINKNRTAENFDRQPNQKAENVCKAEKWTSVISTQYITMCDILAVTLTVVIFVQI